MKILLINNHTQHFDYLSRALAGHEIEVQLYEPGIEFHHEAKDLIILSGGGGEGLEIHDEHKPGRLWYEDEIKFVEHVNKPILGICMGFEVIARTFGSKVKKMPKGIEIFAKVQTTDKGQKLFAKKQLIQYEAHDWHVTEAPAGFEVLADSKHGLEIIRHKHRPILATQFHPEKGGTLTLENLLDCLYKNSNSLYADLAVNVA